MKQNKNKVSEEAIAFLPDAIEIKNEKLPLWARYSVIFSLVFFVGVIIWASLGRVDVVVKASGEVTSSKQNIVMKPRESSMIKKIMVRVGDVVEKDQLLVTFDPTLNAAEVERIKREIAVLSAKYERFMAEFKGVEYKPATLDINSREQLAIFKQRNDYYESKIRYYDEALKQLDASRKSREDSVKNQISRLETVRKMEQMYDDLRKKQATTLKELWNVQITRIEMEGNLGNP